MFIKLTRVHDETPTAEEALQPVLVNMSTVRLAQPWTDKRFPSARSMVWWPRSDRDRDPMLVTETCTEIYALLSQEQPTN